MPNRMDQIVSKSVGKAKGLKARLGGLVGVFKTIAEQHGEVSALLRRLRDAPEKKPELWPTIRRELLSHERAELREVFPVMRARPELRPLADHHDEEAGQLEQLIDQVDKATHAEWGALFDRLVDTVLHHADEEEDDIFPKAMKVLGDKEARELEPKFLAAKKAIAASA